MADRISFAKILTYHRLHVDLKVEYVKKNFVVEKNS